ncbi:MAG: ABC transporter permease [Vicingaceae bacterium]
MFKLLGENIREALRSIKSQLLRTILTVLIIAVGITALVGILTSIDAMEASITNNFSNMGANTFAIRNYGTGIHADRGGKKRKVFERISYDDAIEFKKRYNFPAAVSVSMRASSLATLKYKSEKTNPNIFVFGVDENYLMTNGYSLSSGRNFSEHDIRYGTHGVIIGSSIKKELFPDSDPIDKTISIGSGKYRVIGVLKEKGSSIGFSADKNAFIPLTNARQYFAKVEPNFLVNVMTYKPQDLDPAIGEATGIFRIVRGDKIGQQASFEISRSDNISQMLIENLSKVTLSATVIGFITLLGAAIGLMNIMLVSVTERTREIGIRKAIGAAASTIRNQFLIEAVVICQLGGLLGIVFGIIIGNVVAGVVGGGFIIPWAWMSLGIGLCIVVGLISGIYPAFKAAKLDPIESLRYE